MVCGKEKTQKNKGVSTIDTEKGCYTDTDTSSTVCGRSVSRIKNEVKTVIELMGPSTPNYDSSTLSYLADNEDSFHSGNMISLKRQNEVRFEEYSVSTDCPCTDKTLPPDITFDEDTNVSVMAAKNSDSADPKIFSPRLVCPPPLFPANVVFNPECMCPQIADYIMPNGVPPMFDQTLHSNGNRNKGKSSRPKNLMNNLLNSFKTSRFKEGAKKGEYYKINIKQSSNKHSVPERLVFDLVDGIPTKEECPCEDFNDNKHAFSKIYQSRNINTDFPTKQELFRKQCLSSGYEDENKNNKPNTQQHTTYVDNSDTTRVDVYYFDHGNSNYLRTTDSPPVVATEALAEKTERYTTKFWAEIFGSFHIGVAFCTSFILQLVRFLLYSIFRPLTIGLVQLLSDYFFKPFLATLFNAVIQPPLIFLYNIATSLRDLCDPIAEGIGYYLREVAFLIKAFRVVEVRKEYCGGGTCKYGERKDRI